jgi:hypothetical protein
MAGADNTKASRRNREPFGAQPRRNAGDLWPPVCAALIAGQKGAVFVRYFLCVFMRLSAGNRPSEFLTISA